MRTPTATTVRRLGDRVAAAPKPTMEPLTTSARRLKDSWGDRRGANTDDSQMRGALDTLCLVLGKGSTVATVDEVTSAHVAECVATWVANGLSASTVNKRLCILSALKINCEGNWRRPDKRLKWWLKPTECERLLAHLRAKPNPPFPQADLVADYVEWASHVGMRVEETLRLTWGDCLIAFEKDEEGKVMNMCEVSVPGTKTERAQASLALASVPALLLARRHATRTVLNEPRVFPIEYDNLHEYWQRCRDFLGVRDNPLSTLKALRRTAARHLTTGGMPTDVVRQYLRHSDIQTTMGYLRLVGGYTTGEQRKWLS